MRFQALAGVLGLLGLAAAACCLGCEPVPDLVFVPDDGGSADASADRDARADADAASADAAAACTGARPDPGATCCAPVWCVGECGPSNCEACARKGCASGELCCGKPGTVLCKDSCP